MKLPASPFSGSAVLCVRVEWAFIAALSYGVPSSGKLESVKAADVLGLAPCVRDRLDEVFGEVPTRVVLRDDIATQDHVAW